VNRNFKKEDEKTMWVLIIALTGIVGALIYYFMVKRKAKSRKSSKKASKKPSKKSPRRKKA
jgi:hypothetical protein